MCKILSATALALLFSTIAFAQVQIDKAISLTGSSTDAKITGIKDVSAAKDAMSVEAFQNGSFLYGGTSGGSATAYTVSLNPAIAGYATGMILYFKAHAANAAGPVTIDVNGKGPKTIKKNGSQDLAAADININQVVCVIYDGANFHLLSQIDGSNTNELQTISASGTGNIDLSQSGGTITLQGTGATSVSRSGNTLTINSTNSGGTVTGTGTATRLAFWSNTSVLSSNANLFWDDANSRLGIGTAAPATILDIRATSPEMRLLETNGSNLAQIAIGDANSDPNVTGEGFRIIYNSANGNSVLRNLYSAGSLTFQTNGANDRLVISNTGSVKIAALAGTGNRLVYADASGTLTTSAMTILGSTAEADALALPSNYYLFNFTGSTGPQILYYQSNMNGGLGYVRVFSSPFAGAATVNCVGLHFPFTKFLIQTSAGANRSTAFFAASRLFDVSSSTVTSNGGTHNGYYVFIGQAGGMGIYNTTQAPCSWANSANAVGAGYDGSCGSFPDALRWGTGNSGTPFYTNVNTTWEVWIAN